MNTTTAPASISFRTNRNGQRVAYRFDRTQHRSFRIALDQALLMISTGAAVEDRGF